MPDPNPIKISFEIAGVAAVRSTFDAIEQRMARFDAQATSRAKQGSDQRTRGARREAEDRGASLASLTRKAEQEERKRTVAALKETKSRERAQQDLARGLAQIEAKATREAERESLARQRVAERETQHRVQSAERAESRAAAIRRQYAQRMGGAVASGAGAGFSNFTGRVAGLATGALALGGGFAVANAMRSEMSFQRSVVQASNMSYIPGVTTRASASPERMRGLALEVQGVTGGQVDKIAAADAIKKYVGMSSDLEGLAGRAEQGGPSNLSQLAKLSVASGTDFSNLIEMAANIKKNNPGMTPSGLIGTVRNALGAGKQGTLPIDQFAAYAGVAAQTASSYSGAGTTAGLSKSQANLFGLTQITGRVADAATASTAVTHFTADVLNAAKKGKVARSSVYEGGDPNKGLLDPATILRNVFQQTGGNPEKLLDVFTMRGGKKVTDALMPVYKAAEAEKKGSGADAVYKAVAGASVEYKQSDVDKEFEATMQTVGARLEKSFKEISEVVEGKAAPFLERFATLLSEHQKDVESFLDSLANLAEFAAKHPWLALGGVMLAEVEKSVAAAAIGQAIRNSLSSAASSGMSAATPLMASVIAAAAASAIMIGIAAIDKKSEEEVQRQKSAAGDVAASGPLMARLRNGTASPEDQRAASELAGRLTGTVEHDTKALNPLRGGVNRKVAQGLGVDVAEMEREEKEHKSNLDDVNQALAIFAARMRDMNFIGPSAPPARGGADAPSRNHSLSSGARGGAQ